MKKEYFVYVLIIVLLLAAGCADLKDDLPPAAPEPVRIHEAGWVAPASAYFHGEYLKENGWNTADCRVCHGASYDGGTSGKPCFGCHDSYPHEAKFSGVGKHEVYMRSGRYPYDDCKVCHGAALTGGARVDVSCSEQGCHVDFEGNAKSPLSCNTCHGNFRGYADDRPTWAPPKSVEGGTSPGLRGVGAHQPHLAGKRLSRSLKCEECHPVPVNVSDPRHIDDPFLVQVRLDDTLANMTSEGGKFIPSPRYDMTTLKCSDAFCHGNWRLKKEDSPYKWAYADSVIIGMNYSPLWTGGLGEAACGSCHGLPPVGHITGAGIDISTCGNCHSAIAGPDGSIVDPSRHINGKINVIESERPF